MHTLTTRWAIYALLTLVSLGVTAPARALPIDYTITFTLTDGSGLAPTEGSFTYDADVPLFTNFHVLWNGQDVDLTEDANNPNPSPSCGAKEFGPTVGFAIMSGTSICPGEQLWTTLAEDSSPTLRLFASADTSGPVTDRRFSYQITQFIVASDPAAIGAAGGTFTIAPVDPAPAAVPEPTSIALLASGLVGVVLRHRRRA